MFNYRFKFVAHSQNVKTGDIPQVYTRTIDDIFGSCPDDCLMKKEGICYAKCGFYTRLAWEKADTDFMGLYKAAHAIEEGTLIRHNVAGDIATTGTNQINTRLLAGLIAAYEGLKAYTYTHCDINSPSNISAVKHACNQGFTINFSCEKLSQAEWANNVGVPAVLTVGGMDGNTKTINGVKYVKCLNQSCDITCKECGLCQKADRKCVVVFEVHGNKAKKAKQSDLLINI